MLDGFKESHFYEKIDSAICLSKYLYSSLSTLVLRYSYIGKISVWICLLTLFWYSGFRKKIFTIKHESISQGDFLKTTNIDGMMT